MDKKKLKWLAIILGISGFLLIILGISMKSKVNVIEYIKAGNKGKYVTVGSIIGGGTGCAVGACIGGIGIAVCGTGIGIPAGAVMLLLSGAGALAGGKTGSIFGNEAEKITKIESMYSWYEYWSVMILGAILILICIYVFYKIKKDVDIPRIEEENGII